MQRAGLGAASQEKTISAVSLVTTRLGLLRESESEMDELAIRAEFPPTDWCSVDGVPQGKAPFSQDMTLLRDDFVPGECDVICGRGRKCFNHIGNVRFRDLVSGFLERYSNAETKLEKSYILSDIVSRVRLNSPNGGFVKKDPLSGRWFEVGDFLAREKTSQAFRDLLHDQYKSSNTAKKKRRQAERADKVERRLSSTSLDTRSNHSTDSSVVASAVLSRSMEFSQDALLGALDSVTTASLVQLDSRKAFAAQGRSARSVFDVSAITPTKDSPGSWFNRSCPNLSANLDMTTPKPLPPVSSTNLPWNSIEWGHHSQPNFLSAVGPPPFVTSELPIMRGPRAFQRSQSERRFPSAALRAIEEVPGHIHHPGYPGGEAFPPQSFHDIFLEEDMLLSPIGNGRDLVSSLERLSQAYDASSFEMSPMTPMTQG